MFEVFDDCDVVVVEVEFCEGDECVEFGHYGYVVVLYV